MVVKKDNKKKADTVNRVYAVQYTYIDLASLKLMMKRDKTVTFF